MATDGLFRSLCAVVTLGLFCGLAGATEDRIAAALEVQAALQQGRTHLLRGDYQAAVHILESQIARDLECQPQYLIALRDAYRGLVKTLKLAGRDAEAAIYIRRLKILDPGSALDFEPAKSVPVLPAPTKQATPAPVPSALVKEQKKPDSHTIIARPCAPDTTERPLRFEDPFSETNHRRAVEARGYLEQAEKLFQANQFDQAGTLYARANEAMPEILKEARERWAYCKMHQVFGRLDAKGSPVAVEELPALEQQVRTAIAMTPNLAKLDSFGKELLASIQTRRSGAAPERRVEAPAPALAIKHTARPAGAKWAVAETANFRMFHNLETEQAEQILRIAETTRVAMQKKWFGNVAEDWKPRCDLYIHADAEAYSRETGAPQNAPGHATNQWDRDRLVMRRLDMRLDFPNMRETVLPHETTHIVLAARLGPTLIPRWADEGMAVLTEPREYVERHLRNLPAHRNASELFTVGQLMEMKDYPQPRLIGAFYAQSVSLVDYLNGLRGSQTFAAFLKDGMAGGYEPALRKHYDIQGYQALQTNWERQAFRATAGMGVAESGN
jgi:tetratricopeptide (TPR) repeat protein